MSSMIRKGRAYRNIVGIKSGYIKLEKPIKIKILLLKIRRAFGYFYFFSCKDGYVYRQWMLKTLAHCISCRRRLKRIPGNPLSKRERLIFENLNIHPDKYPIKLDQPPQSTHIGRFYIDKEGDLSFGSAFKRKEEYPDIPNIELNTLPDWYIQQNKESPIQGKTWKPEYFKIQKKYE